MDTTQEEAIEFLNKLWYSWGTRIIEAICSEYEVSEEIKNALFQKYMRPNDWYVQIK